MGRPRKDEGHKSCPEENPAWRFNGAYEPKYCQMLIDHMKEGGSFAGFAGRYGIGLTTIEKWARERQDFKEAYEDYAKPAALEWFETVGKRNLHNKEFNTTLFIFTMHNRFRDARLGGYRKGDPNGTHNVVTDADGKVTGFLPVEGYKGQESI